MNILYKYRLFLFLQFAKQQNLHGNLSRTRFSRSDIYGGNASIANELLGCFSRPVEIVPNYSPDKATNP